jgi:hypothetical protein
MKLNVRKIELELNRLGKTWYWIAKELNYSWNRVKYWKTSGSLRGAEPVARVLGLNPKDLVE